MPSGPRTLFVSALLALCCGACAPAQEEPTPAPGSNKGTLAVTFRIDDDYADAMDEPPVGPFWGTLFYSDQVTGIGPDDGAVELGDIYVEEVDLSADRGPSEVLFVTGPLPLTWVTILGFMDSDANSVEGDRDPDSGDPVTLPNSNEFQVVEDQETRIEVFFDFLNP